MTLGEKQEKFFWMLVCLGVYLLGKGYRVRPKHLLRCKDCKVGHERSCHKDGLAIDLVFMDADGPITNSEEYAEAGEYWEYLGGSWGGRFNDGGHFSIEHNGVK